MFIALLCLAAFSIAGSAAYFSVYGLANTFHGVFWSVVILGGSLEFGKLVATSYLYRYWKTTNFILKSYLITGVLALMVLTSMGIFGYLSAGYQEDTLPLKQLEQQTKLLDEEKVRLIERKHQIDNQVANLPSESSRSRVKLMKAFKDEQVTVTNRISQLDQEVLQLKTKVIQTEAHTGPIIYIAKAMGMEADDATKILILLIIFVFDPMAVALTLAVNTAIKQREDEQPIDQIVEDVEDEIEDGIREAIASMTMQERDENEMAIQTIKELVPTIPNSDYATLHGEPWEYKIPTDDYPDWSKPSSERAEEPVEELKPTEQPTVEPLHRRVRPYAGVDSHASIDDLVNQYQYYKSKIDRGDVLTQDEQWALQATKDALQRQGFNVYI